MDPPSSKRKVPTRRRKEDLLRDLFGEENPDLPSPQDRWINIQAVVREVYKELGRENGFIDKRWTEIVPRWKQDLGAEVLLRLAECDRVVLEARPDVIERLLKDHVSNRGDWKKEKARKRSQQAERSPPQDVALLRSFEPEPLQRSTSYPILPPLSTFDEGVEHMKQQREPRIDYY